MCSELSNYSTEELIEELESRGIKTNLSSLDYSLHWSIEVAFDGSVNQMLYRNYYFTDDDLKALKNSILFDFNNDIDGDWNHRSVEFNTKEDFTIDNCRDLVKEVMSEVQEECDIPSWIKEFISYDKLMHL